MKEPNFFILGAPKCGTTALASYLAEHPEVFMTDPKEPHHYNTDHRHGSYKNRKAYLSLFAQAGNKHKAVGEASVWYLYSQDAVRNILSDYPDAKFIVMLRNPVEMAPSLYRQKVFSAHETAKSFEKAWHLQETRRKGKEIPYFCTEPRHLLYKEACSLGNQCKRLLAQVDKDRVFTIIHDDFKSSPDRIWRDTLEFLCLTHDGRDSFPSINNAKARRSIFLKRFNDLYVRMRYFIGVQGLGTGFFTRVDNWNRIKASNNLISPELHNTMKAEFRDDVLLLSDLLGRDLSDWVVA